MSTPAPKPAPAKASPQPVTPHSVILAALLYAPATKLVPRAGLPAGEIAFLSAWTPGAVVSTVPKAAVTALTPQAVAAQLTPGTLAQSWVQSLAMAAVMAALA